MHWSVGSVVYTTCTFLFDFGRYLGGQEASGKLQFMLGICWACGSFFVTFCSFFSLSNGEEKINREGKKKKEEDKEL